MPDDEKLKPGIDKLTKNVSTVETNRAKRINSLTNKMNDLVQDENQKRLQMSTEINSLTKQQQENMKDLDLSRANFTNKTTSGFNKVIKGLGDTISSLASGVKTITTDTALASKNAVTQYGKAISEDISINKTNTIAMALSRATPLFGYFAAKFMETDVFQNAATKIRENVGASVKKGLSMVGGLFTRSKEKAKVELPYGGRIEGLQRGGYVKKGGVVKVHPAEVITPVDKLVRQITLASGEVQRKNTENIIDTFLREYRDAKRPKEEKWQKRLLKTLDELKAGTLGMASRFNIALTRTLLKHPTFRAALLAGEMIKKTLISPLKFFFAFRGGYAGDVRKAMSTSNVQQKSANVLALIYTKGQPKLDQIAHYTRLTAQATAGANFIEAPGRKGTTRFKQIKQFMTTRKIGEKGSFFKSFVSSIGLDAESLEEAGITKLSDFGRLNKIRKRAGITKENIIGKLKEKQKIEKTSKKSFKEAKEEAKKAVKQRTTIIKEGMERNKILRKVKKASEKTGSFLGRMGKRLKKLGGKFGIIFLSLFSVFSRLTKPLFWLAKLFGMGGLLFGKTLLKSFLFAGKGFLKAGWFFTKLGAKIALPIAGILANAIPVAMAGAMGYIIGTLINLIIVNPIVKWYIKFFGKTKAKAGLRIAGLTGKALKFKAEGGELEKQGETFLKLKSSMLANQSNVEARGDIELIQMGQQEYAFKNLGIYEKYSNAERRSLRDKFVKNKVFRLQKRREKDLTYGKLREESFLKYLQQYGNPTDEMERTTTVSKAQLAETAARGETAKRKALAGDLEKANGKLVEGQKAMTTAVMQNTTMLNNTTANTSNTTIGGGGAVGFGTASSGGVSAERTAQLNLDR